MKYPLIIAVVLLFILHQDFWNWDNPNLVMGFMPIGLAYHAIFSLVAAGVWALAVKFCWPERMERFAEEGNNDTSEGNIQS